MSLPRVMTPSGVTIEEDEPLTLAEACQIIFRNTIKPATLRAEHARGNLVIERIGRRDFVTLAALRAMRDKCRVQRREPASGSTERRDTGLSETDRLNAARAMALKTAQELRRNSATTSRENTNRQSTVVRLGS